MGKTKKKTGAFVKVVKNKAYYKRFQVKYRRRREGKTDYAQRRQLVHQDKNKYNTPKYRLVVRLSNKQVTCQIVYATICGDRTICTANSTELARYGLPVSCKNYPAAYATGLLVARRLLKQLGLDTAFEGQKKVDGEEYHIADEFEGDRRPFRCILDIGLVRTTIGSRVFAALKGAADGGLDIPHNVKRFPGYSAPESGSGEGEYSAEAHRDRIMGKHVADYMLMLKDDDPEEYERHFGAYIKKGVTADNLESIFAKVHSAIRADPTPAAKKVLQGENVRKGNTVTTPSGKSYVRNTRMNHKQRKARVLEKIRLAQDRAMADE